MEGLAAKKQRGNVMKLTISLAKLQWALLGSGEFNQHHVLRNSKLVLKMVQLTWVCVSSLV